MAGAHFTIVIRAQRESYRFNFRKFLAIVIDSIPAARGIGPVSSVTSDRNCFYFDGHFARKRSTVSPLNRINLRCKTHAWRQKKKKKGKNREQAGIDALSDPSRSRMISVSTCLTRRNTDFQASWTTSWTIPILLLLFAIIRAEKFFK